MKGGATMATYITLINWTQKGMENIKESPARLDAAKKAFQAVGGEIKDFFLVTGAGAVRTETLSAFTEDEYRQIIASLP